MLDLFFTLNFLSGKAAGGQLPRLRNILPSA